MLGKIDFKGIASLQNAPDFLIGETQFGKGILHHIL